MPNPGEPLREVIARGRSMYPLIADGSRVGLERVDPATLRPGEIIAFEREQIIVLHRVLNAEQRADGLWLREKGDNNRFSTWLPATAVLGRARWAQTEVQSVDLAPAPADLRVRLLTALSRIEAWFGDRAARAGQGQGVTWRSHAFVLLTLPLRLPALALLSAYRRTPAEESERDRAETVALYRVLATGEGALPAYREGLLRMAVAHGLESLWAVAAAGVPDLQRMRHRAGFQYLSLVTALKHTRAALEPAGVPFLVLKGPPLAARVYGDGAARIGFDIDVLVRRRDRERAVQALLDAGFRCRTGAVATQLIKRGHFHLVFDPPAKVNAAVELHWELVDRANLYRIEEDAVWTNVRTDASCGVPVQVLGREEELVYLCLHAAKHGFLNGAALAAEAAPDWFTRAASGNRLIWMMDVAKLAHRERVDWIRVAELSNRWNVGEPVLQLLDILIRLAPTPAVTEGRAVLQGRILAERRTGPVSVERLARWMRPNKTLVIRPARLLELKSLFFPGPRRLARYYGRGGWWRVFTHPAHMLARLVGG